MDMFFHFVCFSSPLLLKHYSTKVCEIVILYSHEYIQQCQLHLWRKQGKYVLNYSPRLLVAQRFLCYFLAERSCRLLARTQSHADERNTLDYEISLY